MNPFKSPLLILTWTLALLAAGTTGAPPASAHEGHATPGTVQAPHGGIVKSTHDLHFELVSNSEGLEIYPLTHDLKPVRLSELTASATSQAPKKGKQPVKLTAAEDHWQAKVDAQGAHRYALELQVQFKGKKHKTVFQVEPQN